MKALELQGVKARPAVYVSLLCVTYAVVLFSLNRGFAADTGISDWFFDFSCHAKNARQCWLLDKSDRHLSFLLHNLPIHILTAIGVFAFCALIASFWHERLRPYRRLNVLAVVGLVAVPGIVALLKTVTGHYCPGQLSVYGGPVGMPGLAQPKPRCFPAGFPAGGFGLLVLCFGALPVFWRRLGLYAGLGIGGLSSVIQIARGEHFLSHCIATLVTAIFVGLLVSFYEEHRHGRPDATPRLRKSEMIEKAKSIFRLGAVVFSVLFLGASGYAGYLYSIRNFHVVVPDELYRSAQLDRAHLIELNEKYHFKTIINLRGSFPEKSWYREEIETAKELSVKHIDLRLDDDREIEDARAEEILAVLASAPKPILLHCHSGTNRSGLVSALYLAGIKKASEEAAEHQMSLAYGHFSIPDTDSYEMDASFEAVEHLFGFGEKSLLRPSIGRLPSPEITSRALRQAGQ